MFQTIVDFITKFKEFFTFLALAILCFAFISLGNLNQISGFRSFMIVITAWLQNSISWIPNPSALKNENKALRELNLQLSEEVTKLRTASIENEKLRSLLEFKNKQSYPIVAAEVVGRNSIDQKNYLTINKGKNDGLEVGMSVRTDAGLVGVIIGITNNYSIVELLNNNKTRVAAKIERTGIKGIFTWDGGNNFTLKNIPTTFDVKKGDKVLTSNYSNFYPDNIPIGEIIEVSNDNASLFYNIKIKSYVNLNSVEEVFVVKFIPNKERLELIKQIEDKINNSRK